ncbi:hypothetical protein C8F01DRAFT_1092034 [Mycena amicta]|nr:hypothetical protein C8F01DRAFT_1092034 [Mycena amicta]
MDVLSPARKAVQYAKAGYQKLKTQDGAARMLEYGARLIRLGSGIEAAVLEAEPTAGAAADDLSEEDKAEEDMLASEDEGKEDDNEGSDTGKGKKNKTGQKSRYIRGRSRIYEACPAGFGKAPTVVLEGKVVDVVVVKRKERSHDDGSLPSLRLRLRLRIRQFIAINAALYIYFRFGQARTLQLVLPFTSGTATVKAGCFKELDRIVLSAPLQSNPMSENTPSEFNPGYRAVCDVLFDENPVKVGQIRCPRML